MKNCQLEAGNLSQAIPLCLGARSGLLTGLAAAAQVFGFRNAGARPLAVSRLDLGFVTTTVATAGTGLAFAAHKVASFTAIQDTGTGLITIDDVIRRRVLAHNALVSGTDFECVIGGTTAISGGTGATVADADEPFFAAVAEQWQVATTPTLAYRLNEAWQPHDRLPLVLDQDEGLIVVADTAFPTALAGRLYVGIDLLKM